MAASSKQFNFEQQLYLSSYLMQFAFSAEDKIGNKVIDDATGGQIQNREILLDFIYSTP